MRILPPTIDHIKQIACQRNGECLSEVYINNRSNLKFRCEFGHEWETCWKNINKGSWCPKCALINSTGKNNKRFDTIENMQEIANKRGGKCISSEYKGAHKKLIWECNLGHQWEAKPNAIKNGTWCPECSIGIGERTCRYIFETFFNSKFPKVRPNWLRVLNGRNAELDGFCEELKIAFEYNGEQHYKNCKHFTVPKYDLFKIQSCQANDVKLFIIKSISSMNEYNSIIDQIRKQAKAFNIKVLQDIFIDINHVYKTPKDIYYLQEIKNIAINNGGICLSTKYMGNSFKLQFKCGNCNYIWEATPNTIKNGHWCPKCANKCINIKDAQELATNRSGKCLSTEYINSTIKMDWECEFGHQWKASYNQIQSGNWCPECFKLHRGKAKKLSIEVYKEAATKKNGQCLSETINSCYDKLKWQCDKGHIWFSRADAIKNTKQWCPECAKIKKKRTSRK